MISRNFLPQILCIIALLFVSCSENEEPIEPVDDIYVSIPDVNFETQLISLGIDTDGLVNQQLLKEDAEKVVSLDLTRVAGENPIKDLTGIEGFTQLRKLSAGLNDIEELDLSSNPLLDTLDLHGNLISTLDISENPQLIFVDLTANRLSSLSGLSQAIRLKVLRLSFNDFEEFSLSNSSVEALLISHNLLTSIDVSGAANLKNILLRSNQLSEIELSSNPQLETLVLSDNKIQQLNLEENAKLTHLFVSSNSLTNLNVSNLQELIHLAVHGNQNLSCVKIQANQYIPTVTKSDTQELSNLCD